MCQPDQKGDPILKDFILPWERWALYILVYQMGTFFRKAMLNTRVCHMKWLHLLLTGMVIDITSLKSSLSLNGELNYLVLLSKSFSIVHVL